MLGRMDETACNAEHQQGDQDGREESCVCYTHNYSIYAPAKKKASNETERDAHRLEKQLWSQIH
jgi:hypothetical protein